MAAIVFSGASCDSPRWATKGTCRSAAPTAKAAVTESRTQANRDTFIRPSGSEFAQRPTRPRALFVPVAMQTWYERGSAGDAPAARARPSSPARLLHQQEGEFPSGASRAVLVGSAAA